MNTSPGREPVVARGGDPRDLLIAASLRARPGASRLPSWARLSGKDGALLAAGLTTLILFPFLSGVPAPGGEDGADEAPGFSQGLRAMPEPGADAMAPGGPTEEDGVVVELSGRDPLALIRSGEAPAPAAAGKPKDAPADWASVVRSAARAAAPLAAKKARLPSPSRKLAGALRGLAERAGSAGSQAAGPLAPPRLAAPTSEGLLSALRPKDSLPPRRAEPFLRAAAKGGSAPGSLLASARTVPAAAAERAPWEPLRDAVAPSPAAHAAGSASGPGASDALRFPAPTSAKDARQNSESLAYLKAKAEMEKEVDLKYAKRKYDELERRQMLDKVNAEGAQKMKETVVGKLLDGAFGLAQKAVSGGGSETAVGANQEAKATQDSARGALKPLGEGAAEMERTAGELERTGDGFLTPKMAAIVGPAGSDSARADAALGRANGRLGRASAALDSANSSLDRAVRNAERGAEGFGRYVKRTQGRLDGWEVASFSGDAGPGPAPAPDSRRELDAVARSHQEAAADLQAAGAEAGAAPKDLSGPQARMRELLVSPAVRRRTEYSALPEAGRKLDAQARKLAQGWESHDAAGERTRGGLELSRHAAQAAREAEDDSRGIDGDLRTFHSELAAAAAELAGRSQRYRAAVAAGDPAGAAREAAAFEARKSALSSRLGGFSPRISALEGKVERARAVLGAGL